MTSLAARLRVPVHHRNRTSARPSLTRLLTDQLAFSLRDLWRSRVAFIFTFLFPLIFLVVIGAMAGNATISAGSSVRVMQFVTPSAAVMGALFGAYPPVAAPLADVRERGVLRRVRGTPLPGSVYLAGRIGAAVLFALGSLVLMLAVGVIAYDVDIQWNTMPATAVTALAAVTCFAAAGVAVAGLARSATVAQAVSIATAVMLAMVSGLMSYGDMPGWAERFGQLFPVKHVNDAFTLQFDPFTAGSGWDVGALVVTAAWAVAAVVVAGLTFRWEPVPARTHRRRGSPVPGTRDQTSMQAPPTGAFLTAARPGRPRGRALLGDQVRWATSSALRDTGWVFFAIALPVGQYAFTAAVMRDGNAGQQLTPPFELQSATGMITWAAMVTGLVFLPDAIARARESGVLKRLRGTPLPEATYFAGRFSSALLLVLATAVLILIAGTLWFDVALAWQGIALALGLLVLGTATLTACGLLLASLLPSSKAVVAVGLGVAIPLGFFSDVWAINAVPPWMGTVGSFFPVKHLANSLSWALDPSSPSVSWPGIAALTVWLLAAALLVRWRFRSSLRS